MKQYCLTDCFKRKMSKGKENLITFLTVTGVFAIVLAILSIMGYGVGYLTVEIFQWFELPKNGDYATFGIMLIMGAILTGFALYMLLKLSLHTGKTVATFAKDRYEGEPFECSIFEECKNENKPNT